jgi:hypothetical protein
LVAQPSLNRQKRGAGGTDILGIAGVDRMPGGGVIIILIGAITAGAMARTGTTPGTIANSRRAILAPRPRAGMPPLFGVLAVFAVICSELTASVQIKIIRH